MNCRVCRIILTDDNWYSANKKHGSRLCTTCSNAKGTAWKQKHPEKSREYARRYYKTHPKYNVDWCRQNRIDIRKEMIAAYGGKCAMCGISDSIVLDIDHIDNSGAEDRKMDINKSRPWLLPLMFLLGLMCGWGMVLVDRQMLIEEQGRLQDEVDSARLELKITKMVDEYNEDYVEQVEWNEEALKNNGR